MLAATRRGRGLGIAVNEMQRSLSGVTAWDETGWHSRKQLIPYRGLGDVPNDFEAAVDLQYTPVRQGWYYGFPVTGGGYASVQRCNKPLGDASVDELTAVQTLARAQKAQVVMQIISTMSIAVLASLAVTRAIYVARHGDGTRVLGDDDEW